MDLFFFAKPTDSVADRNVFFQRTAALPTTVEAMREVKQGGTSAGAVRNMRGRINRAGALQGARKMATNYYFELF